MSIKFFGILTHQGAARLANAAALGVKLELSTMAVGDGGGSLPFPEPTQTALKGERRRAALNHLSIDPLNGNQIIAEQVIPENEGGWWIREMGLFDKDGTLIAVANCPESYKPQMQEGSGRTQTIRMILIVNSAEALALKIDPSIVLATRQYVDDGVIEVKAYADTLMKAHLNHADPHPQYAPKASPVFTGTPTAPTAKLNNNSTQLATTAFVQSVAKAQAAGRLLNIQSFTHSGTYTPTPGTRKIRVKCWGAGGGGGGTSKQSRGSVSGAAGAYAEALLDATSFSSVSVEVGTGGAASADSVSQDGGNGGGSYFGTLVSCGGGNGGLIGQGLAKGGEPAGGNVMMVFGQSGQGGTYASGFLINGVGGASFGGYNALPHVSKRGDDGSYPGGGGAMGSYVDENTHYASGKGGDGLIIIEEYS
ncbi:phage tail protein [Sodalis endosymbiont of Spalangia cameroni]|uniref:phage tail protein n=1 Tax=Sodalis praecaptivus TaxID=1239307 RepID=UPI0031F74EDF